MRALERAIWIAVCLLSLAISGPVLLSSHLRFSYTITVLRRLAWLWPQDYAFIGDSLTLDCKWRWMTGRPLSTVVLARGGAGIKEIAQQVTLARALGAKHLFIEAGINDILISHDSTDQIARSFNSLLRSIDVGQTAVITLIPFVSDPAMASSITMADAAISVAARQRGFSVIDLNTELASEGIRKPRMTYDGIHFTQQACAIWSKAIAAQIALMTTK
jgi:GDSL-like Lipase/Acylhydrolase family